MLRRVIKEAVDSAPGAEDWSGGPWVIWLEVEYEGPMGVTYCATGAEAKRVYDQQCAESAPSGWVNAYRVVSGQEIDGTEPVNSTENGKDRVRGIAQDLIDNS